MKPMPPNKAIVIITNDSSWSERDIIHIRGDRYAVTYRANVRTEPGEEEHLIVSAFSHSIGQAERDAINCNLRETNPKAAISFLIADRKGWAQVTTAPDEKLNLFNLAAATSVIKASCGWDESLPIVVEINGSEVRVWPRFDGQYWIADNREETV
jgi:hypothetical protein